MQSKQFTINHGLAVPTQDVPRYMIGLSRYRAGTYRHRAEFSRKKYKIL